MNEIQTVTLQQAVQLIVNNPKTRFVLRGEPGVGKTSIAQEIASANLPLAMLDCPNLDLDDVCVPEVIVFREWCDRYYPNARFGIHTGEPVVMVLDRTAKAADQ